MGDFEISNQMKEPKIIRIDWIDVQALDLGLFTLEDLKDVKPTKCSIIGWLVKEDKENYYVAKEFWASGEFKYIHIIPKKTAIIKITELK